jgi:hypothetical protein
MKTKHLLPFCLLITAILTSGVSGFARFVTDSAVGAWSSSSTIDLHGLQYIPDSVIITKDDVVYLLSRANLSLFRWSVAQRQYLPSISLAQAPDLMAYSDETDRIYLSYPDQRITQIKMDQTPLQEAPYIQVQESVSGLATAGSYIFTHDDSGGLGTNYTYGSDGNLISSKDLRNYSAEYIWSPANRKMYYFRDDMTPNDLFWEEIVEDGSLGETMESPYHEDEPFVHPIRVKPDGSDVLLGSGIIFDALNLEKKTSLPNSINDAAWSCGNLFTLRAQDQVTSLIQKWEDGYLLAAEKEIYGTPIKIFPVSEGLLYITLFHGKPWFTIMDCQMIQVYQTPYPVFLPLVKKDFCPDIFDDFSNPATGWPVGEDNDVLTEYLEGEYRVLTKNDAYFYMFRSPGCEHQYFQLEVDARWVGEPGFAYGLVYGINEDWSQYNLFIINTDYREFGYYVYINDYLNEYSYQSTPAIYPSTLPNHLKVTRRFENLILEINGTIVLDTNDPDNIGPRSVGLVVIPYDGYPIADTRFDNFAKRSLTQEEIYPSGTIGASFEENCVPVTSPIPLQQLKSKRSIIYNP